MMFMFRPVRMLAVSTVDPPEVQDPAPHGEVHRNSLHPQSHTASIKQFVNYARVFAKVDLLCNARLSRGTEVAAIFSEEPDCSVVHGPLCAWPVGGVLQ
jgi:hypothetical protein